MRRSPQVCYLYQPGLVPFPSAWAGQQAYLQRRRADPTLPDVLVLLEHPPVYTLGQGATLDFLKFDPATSSIPLHRIERGGEVTYHCPGQLVGYPLLNLQQYRPDLHWYLRQLELTLIDAIAPWGLTGEQVEGLTGVWVQGRKVAAIGIKVSRWCTMHGFALNICPDLQGFQHIVPCGIGDRPVGSLDQFVPGIPSVEVQHSVCRAFAEQFGVELVELPTDLALDLGLTWSG